MSAFACWQRAMMTALLDVKEKHTLSGYSEANRNLKANSHVVHLKLHDLAKYSC